MPNMAVQYRGPNPALLTLTKELRARFGDPARTYEFVTGYKSPGNYSGHNPDNNGIVHAVDIFVGPGNLSAAQGMDVAERIRLEGQRGDTPGVPARAFYLIHNRRIAGGSEGWAWRPYTGADPHTDHIHVSTADTYWGDPVALDPSNYNTTAAWNLWGSAAKPLGTTKPVPIQEDEFIMAEAKQIIAILTENQRRITQARDQAQLNYRVAVESQRRITETREIVRQIAAQTGVTIDMDAIRKAAADGVTDAIKAGVDLDATVTIKADQ